MRKPVGSACLLLAALSVCSGCDAPEVVPPYETITCNPIGCVSGVSWSGALRLRPAPTHLLRFDFCKNFECDFLLLSLAESQTTRIDGSLPGAMSTCFGRSTEQGFELSCMFEFPAADLVDGDEIELTISLPYTGEVLVHARRTVIYHEYRSAAEPCGEVCRTAVLSGEI
jgi:hypothetical protein